MSLEKLLVIAALGRKAHRTWLFQRMLARGLLMTGIVLLITLLLGAWLVGLLYAAHIALLQQGLTPALSLLITSLLAFSLITLLGLVVQQQARQLARMVAPTPLPSRMLGAYNAFMDGLREK